MLVPPPNGAEVARQQRGPCFKMAADLPSKSALLFINRDDTHAEIVGTHRIGGDGPRIDDRRTFMADRGDQ